MTYKPGPRRDSLLKSPVLPDNNGRSQHECDYADETEIIRQRILAPLNFDLIFTRDSLNTSNPILFNAMSESQSRKVAVFVDGGVARAFPGINEKITGYLSHYNMECLSSPVVYPGGEMVKDGWHYVMDMMNRLVQDRLCRHSFCIAIGGGALLDAAGLASSLVHRGIRLVRMPTTVLSQDDSGVGVKNGINYNGVKNLIGAFSPPFAVVNDFDFLKTLTPSVIRDGIAEAFKVAIIKDEEFFHYLRHNAAAIKNCKWKVIETAVKRSATLHLNHIGNGGDPMELGEARPLDFGHWSAHKMESMSSHSISHGTAVALGISLDTVIANLLNHISEEEKDLILKALYAAGMPLFSSLFEKRDNSGNLEVLQGIEEFREHLGGRLCITLPKGIGNRVDIHALDENVVIEAINILKHFENNIGICSA
jgi:3-dehydroquinate synthase